MPKYLIMREFKKWLQNEIAIGDLRGMQMPQSQPRSTQFRSGPKAETLKMWAHEIGVTPNEGNFEILVQLNKELNLMDLEPLKAIKQHIDDFVGRGGAGVDDG